MKAPPPRHHLLLALLAGLAPASARARPSPPKPPLAAQPAPPTRPPPASPQAQKSPGPNGRSAPRREARQRTLTLTDADYGKAQEVRVERGLATLLLFEQPIKERGVSLVDVRDLYLPVQTTEKSVILIPRRPVPAEVPTALSVSLADGTELTFQLLGAPPGTEPDLQVAVELRLKDRASPDSPARLKADLNSCQLRLNACRGDQGSAGVDKLADLVLARADFSRPEAFVAEARKVRWIDKQSRLLVEARLLYRLFDKTYLVLSVENQDSSREWVLDHAEVKLAGGGESQAVKVLSALAQQPVLPSAAEGRVVVVFDTPSQARGQKFDVTLLEKAGPRHVTLQGFEL